MNHLMPEEVHAVLQSLSDLYVKDEKGYGDLKISIHREPEEGTVDQERGFLVSLSDETVTLGVGLPEDVRHEEVPLTEVYRVVIER